MHLVGLGPTSPSYPLLWVTYYGTLASFHNDSPPPPLSLARRPRAVSSFIDICIFCLALFSKALYVGILE